MSYENKILLSKKAFKELKTVPSKDRKAIKDKISKLAFFPLVHLDVRKLKGFENTYRLRVGNYRIIFEYYKDEKLIKVLKIGARGDVYNNL